MIKNACLYPIFMDVEKEISNLQEQVRKLYEKIEEITSIIESNDNVGSLRNQSENEVTTKDDLVDVVDFKVKLNQPNIIGGEWFAQDFAFKVQVKNNTSQIVTYDLFVIFEDKDEFELVRRLALVGQELKPNQTVSESGIVNIMEKNIVDSYKEITCYVEPHIF